MQSLSTYFRSSLWISCFLVFGICFSNIGYAQYVVISEYQNVVSVPEGEYTELLIVADKVDLVGYTLRDNSASGLWQGGIKFRDNPLWKNLRMGTVIVIGHRNIPSSVIGDLNASDGSIVSAAVDANLFEKVLFTSTDWNQDALSIAQTADMIQLLDPAGNPHYTLGHGNAAYRTAYFDPISVTTLKLFHEVAGITNNVYVYPGQSLTDYNIPNPGNAKTRHTFFLSPSFPNIPALSPASTDVNQLFWRDIRAPKWPFPLVTGTVSQASVNISWNQAEDLYPADNYQGYLIMRGEKIPNAIPQDGRTYNVGELIGGWEVVANIIGTGNTTFIDYKPLICGDTTNYRIYAFRFTAPNILIDSIYCSQFPFVGKGRSYQEITFGTFSAVRPAPAVPTIIALGATEICDGTEVPLKVQTSYPSGTGYQWFKDGAPINGAIASEYKVRQAGTYRVKINAPSGCSNESSSINVTLLPKPDAVVNPSKEVRLCTGDSIQLQAGPQGSTFTWLFNGSPLAITGSSLIAKQAGTYRVIVKDAKGCIDTSEATTLAFRSIAMTFPDPKIDFGNLDGCKSSISASNLLRNSGKDTAVITKVDVPNGFQYVSPSLPIILAPGKTATLTFAFNPLSPGESKGDAIIQTSSCNAFTTLNLRGFKEQASVTQSFASADFGIDLTCNTIIKDTIITIDNKGNADLIILTPITSSPYSITSPAFPLTIKANTSSSISIRYAPVGEGIFMNTILLPYTSGTCKDTLRIAFTGELRTPSYVISNSSLIVSPLMGCTLSRDTSITVTNTGKTDIRLNTQTSPGLTITNTLPSTLKPSESVQVNVRIEPLSDGAYVGVVSFLANECSLKKELTISTMKQSASYAFSTSSHQFNGLVRCDGEPFPKDTIIIKASALGITGDAQLSDLQITGPFTTTLAKGDIISGGSKDFVIAFVPNADGVFSGKLQAVFEPCSITKTIDLTGTLSSGSITINQTIITFPVTDSGIVEQRQFTCTNNGKENIRIRSIGGFKAPFTYASTKNIGENISSGETVTFTISYAPTSNSKDSMNAVIEFTGLCPKTFIVDITGTGNLPKPTDVNGIAELIGDSQSAAPGETVIFPIRISSQNLAEMKLGAMTFDIAYNPSLLLPKTVRSKQNQLTITMAEMTPGILSFSIVSNDSIVNIQAGNLLEFECMALLGDAMTTPLTIKNQTVVKRTPGTCTLTTNEPMFLLKDVCDLPNRLIKPNGTFAIAKSMHSLIIDIALQDNTTLDVFAMDGSRITRLIDGSLSSGKYEYALPTELPSGVYVAVLRSGYHVRTLRFDHVR